MRVRALISAVFSKAHVACATLIVLATLATPVMTCAAEMAASQGDMMPCCESGDVDCSRAMITCCSYSAPAGQQIRASKTEQVVKVFGPASVAPHPAAIRIEPALDASHLVLGPDGIDSSPPHCSLFSVLLL